MASAPDSGEGSSHPIDDYENLISINDVDLLKRAWRNEKAAPEILRYETHLIQRISGQIQLMEETVDDFTENGIDPLTLSLYQMDVDRTQFLLRSYLRIRLQKIEKYIFHILKRTELFERLSEKEKSFARRFSEDIGKHLEVSVLSNLPENYQSIVKQSTTSEEDDMEGTSSIEGRTNWYQSYPWLPPTIREASATPRSVAGAWLATAGASMITRRLGRAGPFIELDQPCNL